MKMNNLVLICALAAIGSVFSQTTIVLQPDAQDGKDAILHGLSSEMNTNFANNNQLSANTWTYNGPVGTVRFVLEFDLSTIPSGATVNSAALSLYGIGNNSGFGGHSTLTGSNEAWIQRITTPWDENTVTWNNQPATSTSNQAAMMASSGIDDDYLDIDVTTMVQEMISSGNNGFLVKLQTEEHYRRLNFASSDHSDPTIRPKLVVTYSNDPCITFRPGSLDGKDALLHGLNSEANTNYGSNNQLSANTWTFAGSVGTVRSLLEFDLSALPAGAIITSSELSLYGIGTNSGFGGHSTMSGSNSAWIQRVTSNWDESLVTWNNQPSTTTVNQVVLPGSVGVDDDYLDLNVTAITQDMINFGNNGFLIKLQTEDFYRRLNFASSDHQNANLHPQLKVCYQVDTLATIHEQHVSSFDVGIFPNPSVESITVQLNNVVETNYHFTIYDLSGKVINEFNTPQVQIKVDVSSLQNGTYFVTVVGENGVVSRKFVVHR